MERGFYNEDIEELLKQKADQYRMYPSDKVWKGIQRSLHPSRKWYWFGFVLFLSAIGYYAFVELFAPSTTRPISENSAPSTTPAPQPASEKSSNAKAVIIPFGSSSKQGNNHTGSNARQNSFVLNPDQQTGSAASEQIAVADGNTLAYNSETPVFDLTTRRVIHDIQALPENSLTLVTDEATNVTTTTASTENILPNAVAPADAAKLNDKTAEEEDGQRVNWLHELAVYELQQRKTKRISWQIAFTPTMNYRKLTSNSRLTTSAEDKNLPLAMQSATNPEEMVNHKPALGFEVGSHIMYAANKTFTFKAGLQFNYSRYDIQAYSSTLTEQAHIALSSSTGIMPDAITTTTHLRNIGGKIGDKQMEVENLRNQYFQLSMPLGVEVNLLGNEKLQVGIAGTLQPTYLMNRNTYLISTDYKNYTKEPSLVRRINLHTSAEAFVSYKMGDLKWQVGPQFRYQLLSSYVKEYPIREQLMEFGIKIGVAKTIR
jgi:hypothetical protein